MLKTPYSKLSTLTALVIILLQLWLVFDLQLFGDESFYWLEGQFLSLSYSELPGWTAWMIRLGTEIFGNNYFAVRIISYAAYLSVFFAIYLMSQQLQHQKKIHTNYLIVLSIPLFVLIAVMALPDIWMIVFAVWIIYFFIKAIKNQKTHHWVILGLAVGCSLNVHVRMWIWLFFAGLSFLICFSSRTKILKSIFLITLPIALLGLIPILVFNYQNEFALFSFQFEQRHPWEFQFKNFSFILSQFVVITPIVLYLWLQNTFTIKAQLNKSPIIAWVFLTALTHWVFYIVVSLFADGLRTTVHWLLVSYVPVLAITSLWVANKNTVKFAMVTGGLSSLLLLSYIGFNKSHSSNTLARILDNSLGWQQLSEVVSRLEKTHNTTAIITDYFMTASELAFELNKTHNIKVLPHSKNSKHGRTKQLEIMNMLIKEPESFNEHALLVVEDSSVKLQDKGKYYHQLCQYFQELHFLESFNVKSTKKQYHIFKVNNKDNQAQLCQIPPLFYVDQELIGEQVKISGWAILHDSGIYSLSVTSGDQNIKVENDKLLNSGISGMFPEIKDENLPNNAFEITLPLSKIKDNTYQIIAISNENKKYVSQNYFID